MPSTTKTTIVHRSPVQLRSQTQSRKSSSSSQIPIKMLKSTSMNTKKTASNKSSESNNSTLNHFCELKSMIQKQKSEYEASVKDLRSEIDSKHMHYENVAKSFMKDLQQIKVKQSEIFKLLHILNTTRLDYALPIGFNKPLTDHHSINVDASLTYPPYRNVSMRSKQVLFK